MERVVQPGEAALAVNQNVIVPGIAKASRDVAIPSTVIGERESGPVDGAYVDTSVFIIPKAAKIEFDAINEAAIFPLPIEACGYPAENPLTIEVAVECNIVGRVIDRVVEIGISAAVDVGPGASDMSA